MALQFPAWNHVWPGPGWPNSLLKNAIVTFFNPSQVQSKLRTARKSRHFHTTIWNPILGFSQPVE